MRSSRRPLRAVLIGLLFMAACGRIAYEAMNDPARDEWQKPDAVVQALRLQPGDSVADVGAGGGYFTFRLADAVAPSGRVYAVDVDQTALDMIAEQARRRGGTPGVVPVRAQAKDAGLEPQSVDLVFTCNTYHHLPDRVEYFRQLMPALRPGGRVAIVEYHEHAGLAGFFGHATSQDAIRQEMETAGYRLAEHFDFLPRQYFLVFQPTRA